MNKINKTNKRKLHYYTLMKEVEVEFEDFIKNNFIDKSKLIEGLIIQYMKEKKNQKNND